MKKFLVVLSLVAMVFVLSSCKEKRCVCKYTRGLGNDAYMYSRALEPKEGHANCSELNATWTASDSTGNVLIKDCVDEI